MLFFAGLPPTHSRRASSSFREVAPNPPPKGIPNHERARFSEGWVGRGMRRDNGPRTSTKLPRADLSIFGCTGVSTYQGASGFLPPSFQRGGLAFGRAFSEQWLYNEPLARAYFGVVWTPRCFFSFLLLSSLILVNKWDCRWPVGAIGFEQHTMGLRGGLARFLNHEQKA